MEVGEVEEAAERRARNLQRRQNQMETEVADSPGLERQGSSTNRRSIGGISGLSHAQLAEHYQHCLKLSAENKVSQKNAFNLQLIDWMAQAIGKKSKNASDGGVDINDFQIAAGTLDASTKIYGFRVDVVYNDTFKLASGLTQSSKQKADENLVEASRVPAAIWKSLMSTPPSEAFLDFLPIAWAIQSISCKLKAFFWETLFSAESFRQCW